MILFIIRITYKYVRKKNFLQKTAFLEIMGNYMKENNIKIELEINVNSSMRDMMSIVLERALDQEMDEKLGYSKYDYHISVMLI